MSRIKIITPEKTISSIDIPIRITDINYGNHLGNDALVSIIHEARVKWLSSMGYAELNIEGASIIMNELGVNYLNESFYGDILTIELSIGDISTVSFELFYNVSTKRNDIDIIIAKAKTGIVFYDYQLKKVCPIPLTFKNVLES